MWKSRHLYYINRWSLLVISALMILSFIVISSMDIANNNELQVFLTKKTYMQLRHFVVGWGLCLLCMIFDYNKLKTWAWLLYILMLFSLLGLFFVPTVQNVHRWYKIPFIGFSLQPSEYAKLVVVIMLSYILDWRKSDIQSKTTVMIACAIVMIPCILILKEPDLGTALVFLPVSLAIFYLGNINYYFVRFCAFLTGIGVLLSLTIFTGLVSHDKMKPYALKVIKEYQYERLNPNNHHQRASLISIGLGGITGRGWKMGEFAGRGWLPYGYTDSVFPALGEEFGLIGLLGVLSLYYLLISFGCRTVAVASNDFGRLLAAGITVYMAMHVIINISMMCGLIPITGVPLILISYGGSSVITTMVSYGLLQSIYSRRYGGYWST